MGSGHAAAGHPAAVVASEGLAAALRLAARAGLGLAAVLAVTVAGAGVLGHVGLLSLGPARRAMVADSVRSALDLVGQRAQPGGDLSAVEGIHALATFALDLHDPLLGEDLEVP